MSEIGQTPAAHWRTTGEADPHGTSYDCERAKLPLGRFTDDELANGAFMNYDARPPMQDIIAGKAHSPIAWMTAVKDRIRWLSRSLSNEQQRAAETLKQRDQLLVALKATADELREQKKSIGFRAHTLAVIEQAEAAIAAVETSK